MWRFPAVPASVPRARAVARDAVRPLVAEEGLLQAILLCLTEAVTNVVVHAYRDGVAGDVEVEARKPDGFLCLYVRDTGVGMKPRVDSPGLGLGLPLIGDLTSDFAVRGRADGAGTELAMRFELTAHAPPVSLKRQDALP